MTSDNATAPAPIITFTASVHVNASPETTFGVLADPRTHLEWTGSRAPDDGFKLLTLEADGPAHVGSVFTSTGAFGSGMAFHDRSEVTEVDRPHAFAFTTASQLPRKHRPTWQARFEHRYEVTAEATGARVDYTGRVFPLNYRPYWLHPVSRPLTHFMVQRMMVANLRQLAQMAEEVSTSDS
jgi:uncharacterized protein YndB with AHSA1/START domain